MYSIYTTFPFPHYRSRVPIPAFPFPHSRIPVFPFPFMRSHCHDIVCCFVLFVCFDVLRSCPVSKQRVDTPKVGGAHNATEDEFVVHGVPRCLDSQGEKLQGIGRSGARAGESLPQQGLKARTSLTPRPSWGDDLSPRSLFSWDAQGTQWHR